MSHAQAMLLTGHQEDEMEPLPADLASAADEVIADTLKAASLQVSCTGCELDYALEGQWAWLRAQNEEVWGLALLRLQEGGNVDMIALANPQPTDD